MPNRHDRRAARKKNESDFFNRHINHLPQLPVDFRKKGVHFLLYHHDDWCSIYDGSGGLTNCNCNVEMTMHDAIERTQ